MQRTGHPEVRKQMCSKARNTIQNWELPRIALPKSQIQESPCPSLQHRQLCGEVWQCTLEQEVKIKTEYHCWGFSRLLCCVPGHEKVGMPHAGPPAALDELATWIAMALSSSKVLAWDVSVPRAVPGWTDQSFGMAVCYALQGRLWQTSLPPPCPWLQKILSSLIGKDQKQLCSWLGSCVYMWVFHVASVWQDAAKSFWLPAAFCLQRVGL